MNIIKTFLPSIFIAWLLIALTFQGGYQFSSFSAGLSKYIMAIGSAWFVDRFLVPGVNTHQLLKDNPTAYSIFLFANIICAGICFGVS